MELNLVNNKARSGRKSIQHYNHIHVLSLLWLSMILLGCTDQDNKQYFGLELQGKFQNANNLALFFEELTPTDLIPVDSIYTDDKGNFEFDLFIEDAGFYRLGTDAQNFITLAVEPNESIRIIADINNLNETYEIKGSPGSTLIWLLNKQKLKGTQEVDSLRALFKQHQNNNDFATKRENLRKAYREIKERQSDYTKNIIQENPHVLASILALYHHFDDKLLLKDTESFEFAQILSKSLCEAYPTNKHVMDLKKRVNEQRRAEEQRELRELNLAIGKTAPEITLPDPGGQPISLSSLRGKVVLIDFWAAWCPPCRRANTELSEVYRKFNNRGFEIFGVSLDRTRDQWLEAIETDNISWIQVSDLRFMNSPVVTLYNVQNLPNNLLINRKGEIIAKDISPTDLENRLRELL